MLVKLSQADVHTCEVLGADTVKLCEMQKFKPRLENDKQSRIEANVYGFKAEFAVARLFGLELPTLNVTSDHGVDLWWNDVSIDVKFTNRDDGDLIFDSVRKFKSRVAILVAKTDDDSVMRIKGWCGHKQFSMDAIATDFGHGPRLYMPSIHLKPIEQLWLKMKEKELSPS